MSDRVGVIIDDGCHTFHFRSTFKDRISKLYFQDGPVAKVGINGVQAPEVLECIADYLREVSKPPHNSRETSIAITKIEEAVLWLDKRTADRKERGVEGTSKP